MSVRSVVQSLKQPEYVGPNRCTPCTIANSVIAALGSAGLAVGLVVGGLTAPVAAAVGAVALGVSAAAIYLRGYLVPYTPTLTKRYFPEWVLAKFDKLPAESGSADSDPAPAVDPEQVLLQVGAVEPCVHEDDLCLTEEFRTAWQAGMDRTDADVDAADIGRVLGLDGDTALTRHGTGMLFRVDGREAGKWESNAALVADVAAASLLADRYDGWADLGPADRSRLLRGLRIFTESCPLCGGAIELGQHTVESCCRSYDVVAVSCDDCESRLFEQRADQVAAAAD
jgi:hypothetical protein